MVKCNVVVNRLEMLEVLMPKMCNLCDTGKMK